MIFISKLAKPFIAIIVVGVVLSFPSCSKSDQEKASFLIKEHAKTTIADYESFEIVQIDSLKEVLSDVYEEKELCDLYSVYYYYLDSIDSMNKTILDLNYYIDENTPILEDLVRRTNAAEWRSLTTFTQSNVYNHLSARNDYQRLYDNAKRLADEMDRADAMRKSLQRDVYNCNDSLSVLRQRTIAFYNDYKPQYLGRGTIVKCRFRGNNSNMMLVSYKVIFNNEISELLSIEEVATGNKQDIKTFVDGIVNENNYYKEEGHQQSKSGVSQFVVIDGSQLRLRLAPSTTSDTYKWPDGTNRHPNVGDKFRYLGESGDFYKIDFKGVELWVSKQYSHLE